MSKFDTSLCSIVYTWVDGRNKEYRRSRRYFGGPDVINTSRDRNNNELKYSLRSLEKYLPWHKGIIYLVTPSYHPAWLNLKHPRLRVINQNDLFPNKRHLPSFNTNAIEQHLWRIPGLSEVFFHMNDDYFFGRKVKKEDLVSKKGATKIFLHDLVVKENENEFRENIRDKKKLMLSAVFNTMFLLNKRYGKKKRYFLCHIPYIYHKTAFEKMHRVWKKELTRTSKAKFRDWKNVVPTFLHHYYLIQDKKHGLKFQLVSKKKTDREFVFGVLTDDVKKTREIFRKIEKKKPKFYALNDNFSEPEIAHMLDKFLAKQLPKKSSFEK
ncbi:MAG: stealth conserved region 3 domain-containing protein [Oligoflexia bacterium]|nr:stealth conserved region 3 domain-containing protein [Oligoflexia bacterium]